MRGLADSPFNAREADARETPARCATCVNVTRTAPAPLPSTCPGAVGAPAHRLMFRHMLPNSVGLVIVKGTLLVAAAIITESGLSYLGFGVQPPTPDWGNMIADGSQYLTVSPWLVIFPGIFLGLSVLSFNLLGDGLRDALDVKSGKKAI